MKWWKDQLSAKDNGAQNLENKLEHALKKYLKKLNTTKSNSISGLFSFFIKHNDGDATNDPINHWNCNWDGKYYGQWIADTIFREDLKNKNKVNY